MFQILADDSPLKRIPISVNKRQAVFLDGIRHSIEVIEVAYSRLLENLTNIAFDVPSGNELSRIIPHIFIDVWAIVDALDKFRVLYQNFPGMTYSPADGVTPLNELLGEFRKIRNIHDHLNGSADRVSASEYGSYGTLRWVTGFDMRPPSIWRCVIRPGTLNVDFDGKVESLLEKLTSWPTGSLQIIIAGHVGNISEVMPQLGIRVKNLEENLAAVFLEGISQDVPVISDYFGRQGFVISVDWDK